MQRSFVAVLFVILLSSSSFTILAQSRDDVLKEIQAKRNELQSLEKQFLAVSQEDREAYADFLRQPQTGLIRLLPREKYDSEVYKKNQQTLTVRGSGAYYSFTRLTHEYGNSSDIELDSNYLSVGFAGYDFGMLLKLGDVPLENVSLDTPAASFVVLYAPPLTDHEIRAEQRRFGTGATVQGTQLVSRLPVELNTTFLLRSVVYDYTDVLVAFRVIRKDSDGSVVILWKLLKQYATPAVARNNNLNIPQ